MTVVEKFLFDRIFDELEPIVATKPAEAEADDENSPVLEPEVVIPTFSEEDVAQARHEGFNAGKEEAAAESLNGIEMKIANSMDVISDKLMELYRIQEESNSHISDNAAELALAVSRKMFPVLNEKGALGEVSVVVEEVLKRLIQEPRIVIKVNKELIEPLTERVDSLSQNKGIEGAVSVIGDENLSLGDVEINWAKGSANRNTGALVAEIDAIIEQNVERTGLEEDLSIEPDTSEIPDFSIETDNVETETSDQLETESSSLAGDNPPEGEDEE